MMPKPERLKFQQEEPCLSSNTDCDAASNIAEEVGLGHIKVIRGTIRLRKCKAGKAKQVKQMQCSPIHKNMQYKEHVSEEQSAEATSSCKREKGGALQRRLIHTTTFWSGEYFKHPHEPTTTAWRGTLTL